MPPTLANGKICYIEMPTKDIARSAQFYKGVFGWNIGKRGHGGTSFDHTVGTWVTAPPPAARPGLLFYVMADGVAATLHVITANGGECVQAIVADATRITARLPAPPRNVPRPV